MQPERPALTVSQVTARIKGLLEKDLRDLRVQGEISNLKRHNNGHLYFTLKDGDAQLRVVMFRSQARLLRFRPENGMQIVARGRVTIYDVRGELQLSAEFLEPLGAGALQVAFEQLKARLAEEGLFDASLKKALPVLPRRIGIITEPLNLLNAADRLRGYKRALRARGFASDVKYIRQGDNREDSGYWRALELFRLPHRPTSVLVCNNQMTMGTLAALRDLHLVCPQQVSLIGFDDFECAGLVNPPVTMVRQPAAELGAAAAKAVFKRIRDPKRQPCEHVVLPTQLVVRQSTASPVNGRKR